MVVIESIAGMCQRTYTASIMAWGLNYEISGKSHKKEPEGFFYWGQVDVLILNK